MIHDDENNDLNDSPNLNEDLEGENPQDEQQRGGQAQDTHREENDKPKISRLSKFLTLILRHQPQVLHLDLDSEGWLNCTVDDLVDLINDRRGFENVVREDIEEIVNSDPKGRYEILDNMIRATYGHSAGGINPLEFPDDIEDLPEYVYYATNNFQLDTMLRLGLIPRERRDRQFLHLSVEIKDAYTVAKHHSRNPKLVRIDVKQAYQYGVKFRKVAPFIVICEEVPSQFLEEITLPEELQYLTHLNPQRRYQRNRRRRGDTRHYKDSKQHKYKSRRSNYRGHKRSQQNRRPRESKDEDYDIDLESPSEFGDVDDIKKNAKSKSTIHFETQKDEDVEFS